MSRLEKLVGLLESQPDDVFLNFGLAMEYVNLGQTEDALARFDRVLQLDPEYSEALQNLALVYKKTGQLDDALTGLERATSLDPRNGKVLWEIADTLMLQGRFEAAEARLSIAGSWLIAWTVSMSPTIV